MDQNEEIKKVVKKKYAEIVIYNSKVCCSSKSACCGDTSLSMIGDEYNSNIDGYVAEADLGLGCGMPTEFAEIKAGDTVVDLGSGAGIDVFISRKIVGENGRVIGIDMTEEMVKKSIVNNQILGYNNVEFRLGDIENIPIDNDIADVVISNCVLNLVPDKQKAFSEIFRILKPGGHFCISDVVIQGEMVEELKKSAELYVGCIAGALKLEKYLEIIQFVGFKNIEVKKFKRIELPEDLLTRYLSDESMNDYKNKIQGIFSITVVASKPV